MIATRDTMIEMRELNTPVNVVEVQFHQLMVSPFSGSIPFAHNRSGFHEALLGVISMLSFVVVVVMFVCR